MGLPVNNNIKLIIEFIIEKKYFHSGLYMKRNKISVPYNPILRYLAVYLFGKRSNKICEPSRGGTGNRLKANKKILRNTPYHKMFIKTPDEMSPWLIEIERNNAKTIARIKFERGPANETTKSSFKGSEKLFLLTGTGLAQQMSKNPDANEASGITTEPTISRCFRGFKVNRPWFLAV